VEWPLAWWVPGVAPHERGAGGTPDWVDVVEGAVGEGGPGLVAGFVDWAGARVAERAEGPFVDRDAVATQFGSQLTTWLYDIAGSLGDPTDRVALCTGHPVLARLLGETTRLAVAAHLELLTRFVSDRAMVVDRLLGAVDPGAVKRVEARRGDPHRGGRSVSIVEFADGRRVVYRPRDVTSHVRFTDLLDRLAEALPDTGLSMPAVVAGDGYGWLEHIDKRAPADRRGAERYAHRLGVLLALLHVMRATDMHHENIIADGDLPVPVDVEMICHPTLPTAAEGDPASRALKSSVYRTGLLPQFVVGASGIADISGGGRQGEHVTAFLTGFRRGYDVILRDRHEFAALARACVDAETRVVVRSTLEYTQLLARANRPTLLRDAGERNEALVGGLGHGALVPYELADLWAGDVPLFVSRPGSRDVLGHQLFERTGLDEALTTLDAMSEVDRRDQEWVIAAAMASRHATSHDDTAPLPRCVTGTAADPQQLLTAACAIADQIVSRSMAWDGRVNWLGLELVDEGQWLVLPMGAGLASGYLGVALFLAQLSEVSGVARYGEIARDAIAVLPTLLETLAGQPAMVAAIGCGGLHGLGGIAFGLARMANLLADDELRALAGAAVELTRSAADLPGPPGWTTGTAGCLAAMTAVHAELGLPEAARLAARCADRLVGIDAPTPGFADGAAGIAWALRTYAARFPGDVTPGQLGALETLTRSPAETGRFGWCTGLAGLALGGPLGDTARWTHALVDRAPLRDLSLCHGEFGIVDVVVALSDDDTARRRYAGRVLDALDQYGPRCGTPEGVPSPGLLTGMAGIGHGLLRLAFGDRVPSVLLLGTAREQGER
jgi:lantibiotic modifying enzyme